MEAPSPDPLHLLVHVPKCAGTTVEQFVLRQFPGRVLMPDHQRAPARYLSGRQYVLRGAESFDNVDFVAGHWFGMSIVRHFPGRLVKPSILLRDPLSHTISLYNYRMQRWMKDGAQSVPFGLWYASRPSNAISDFILQNFLELPWWRARRMSRRNRLEVLDEALRSFWFTGPYTSCGTLISHLAQDYGSSPDFATENVTNVRLISEQDLPPELRARILEESDLDGEIFARFGSHVSVASHATDDRLRILRKDLGRPLAIMGYRIARLSAAPAPCSTFGRLKADCLNALRNSVLIAARLRSRGFRYLTAAAAVSVGYSISPWNLIPNSTPVFGYFDNVAVAVVSFAFSCCLGPNI
jgi:hypothetical protein